MNVTKNVWELIMDYDPNGLLAIDENYDIKLVNPAFVKMFFLEGQDVIGRSVFDFFDDYQDFYEVNNGKKNLVRRIKEYPNYGITVSEVTFKIEDEKMVVKIFHDITDQERKEKELRTLKLQIMDEVQKIVDKQMKTGQEIASILGETTAETKASLVKLLTILKKES
ncbi:PAS domain S-box protein [Oceanotoga sp. DSM 15011]|uniref:PAS domain S-box-containing protein n=1 Tax=Oceanotoga teriensis TaxID=515440 RepID=A0AA45C8Q9_9BACT|nr:MULTISPECIES: PAS domain S-box protein [Oceanotoga]MDO7975481.1 PAS domain S-box protein [Oceanotoga teriensis]PWJ96231.1 PAS domain S-box-containing protein [Oceanotoga teriensis]UYP00015.1 PAS domain S-box protein [Oceanotoga sp. DSM 15011]